MKHLKLFESQRDVSDIEDLLLSFADTAKISDVDVNESSNYYVVEFKFNRNIIGNEKVKLIDEIIDRLKRKFEYIKVMKNCMYVFKRGVVPRIPDETIAETIQKKLDYVLKDLTVFKRNKSDKFDNTLIDFDYYGRNRQNLKFCYSRERNQVGIIYDLYRLLEDTYMLNLHDSGAIIIDYFNEHYNTNIKVRIPHDVTFGRMWSD